MRVYYIQVRKTSSDAWKTLLGTFPNKGWAIEHASVYEMDGYETRVRSKMEVTS